jgi:endonuclease III
LVGASARAIPNGVENIMATTVNKQRLVTQLLALGKRAAAQDTVPPARAPRPVLEEFIYGLCRENATREQADRAYAYLRERFFDWNEVRVSSTRELEDAFAGLTDSESRAQRLVAFLQEVFETTFSFDLDDLLKKGLKQAAKQLSRYQAHNEYVGAWVMQRSLGGHAIPVDAATLRCSLRLGLIEGSPTGAEGARSALEHVIPKAKGATFADFIANVAEEHCWEDAPKCSGCPLAGDCPTAQEGTVLNGSTGRAAHRAKPR